MGDYYSIRFTAALTSAGEEKVRTLLHWQSWKGVHETFAQFDRSQFIPFGGLSSAPDGWEQARDVQVVAGTPIWHVCCSIKVGTDDTVHYFINHVLKSLIALPTKVEWWNELTGATALYVVHPNGQVLEVLERQEQAES
jgi:hypothetical protein